jgi:light-regulated signal transduction histidine kinase (bacteriophytochrome)
MIWKAYHPKAALITRDPLTAVMADSIQLSRVFQNLIGNALKYRADRPLQVHIGAERLDNELRIFVKDNGIGIESKNLEHIFEMFERLDSGKNYPGTGMASDCKKIVEHHGGEFGRI